MVVAVPSVAFYTRISTDETHQKHSLGAQREQIAAFCRKEYPRGWKLFGVYRDTASGRAIDRPGLRKLLSDAETRVFDVVVVFRVDRVSRRIRDFAHILGELAGLGIELRSVKESFEARDASGRMMAEMLGVFAEFESVTSAARQKLGRQRRAMRGEYVGGRPPYGYDLVPGEGLVVNEAEARVVKRIFDLYANAGLGYTRIARRLYEEGARRRCGNPWGSSTVMRVVKNPVYAGKVRCRGEYDGKHEPIVSEGLYRRAIDISAKRANTRSSPRSRTSLLARRIRCGLCGSSMHAASGNYVEGNGKDKRSYVCRRRLTLGECRQRYVNVGLIEEAIVGELMDVFRDEDLVHEVCRAASRMLQGMRTSPHTKLAQIGESKRKVKQALDTYCAALEEDTSDAGLCPEMIEELRDHLAELTAREEQVRSVLSRLRSPMLGHRALSEHVEQLEEALADGDGAERRRWLHALVKQVTLHGPDRVDVEYLLPHALLLGRRPSRGQSAELVGEGLFGLPEMSFKITYGRALKSSLRTQEVEVRIAAEGGRQSASCSIGRRLSDCPPLAEYLDEWHARLAAPNYRRR